MRCCRVSGGLGAGGRAGMTQLLGEETGWISRPPPAYRAAAQISHPSNSCTPYRPSSRTALRNGFLFAPGESASEQITRQSAERRPVLGRVFFSHLGFLPLLC